MRRVCDVQQWKPWVDLDTIVTVRWYRVAPGTPALPYWNTAGTTDCLEYRPKDLLPIQPGMQPYPVLYDKGQAPSSIGTKFVPAGRPGAWVGALKDVDPPLTYDPGTQVCVTCGIPAVPLSALILDGRGSNAGSSLSHLRLIGNVTPPPSAIGNLILARTTIPSGGLRLARRGEASGSLLLPRQGIAFNGSFLELVSALPPPPPPPSHLILTRASQIAGSLQLKNVGATSITGSLLFPSQGVAVSEGLTLLSPHSPGGSLRLLGCVGTSGHLVLREPGVISGTLLLRGPTISGQLQMGPSPTVEGALRLARQAVAGGMLIATSPVLISGTLRFPGTSEAGGALQLEQPLIIEATLRLSSSEQSAGSLMFAATNTVTVLGELVVNGEVVASGSLTLESP